MLDYIDHSRKFEYLKLPIKSLGNLFQYLVGLNVCVSISYHGDFSVFVEKSCSLDLFFKPDYN